MRNTFRDCRRMSSEPMVDHALQTQHSAGGCGGYTMLARSRLRDNAPLAHVLGQQRLPPRRC